MRNVSVYNGTFTPCEKQGTVVKQNNINPTATLIIHNKDTYYLPGYASIVLANIVVGLYSTTVGTFISP